MATLEIPPDIPDVEIKKEEVTENGDRIVTVVSTVEGTRTCSISCGKSTLFGL